MLSRHSVRTYLLMYCVGKTVTSTKSHLVLGESLSLSGRRKISLQNGYGAMATAVIVRHCLQFLRPVRSFSQGTLQNSTHSLCVWWIASLFWSIYKHGLHWQQPFFLCTRNGVHTYGIIGTYEGDNPHTASAFDFCFLYLHSSTPQSFGSWLSCSHYRGLGISVMGLVQWSCQG